MKLVLGLFLCLLMVGSAWGIGENGFVLNVVYEDEILKEILREVSIPFYSEYKLRLRNTNDRRGVAKIRVDGVQVSVLGDIVIPANGQIDLERFLDKSLTEGKRFKFVPLSHPEVNDPYSEENGEIVVEFRLEKKRVDYLILPSPPNVKWQDFQIDDSIIMTFDCSSSWSNPSIGSVTTTSASNGATIGGSMSGQSFREVHFDIEDKVTTLRLKMVGI